MVSLALSFLLSTCPDLSGSYLCIDEDEQTHLTILSSAQEFLFQQNDLSYSIIPDGGSRDLPDLGHVRNAKYQAACKDNKLQMQVQGMLHNGGHDIGLISYENEFKKTAKNDLLVISRFSGSTSETLLLCKRQEVNLNAIQPNQ